MKQLVNLKLNLLILLSCANFLTLKGQSTDVSLDFDGIDDYVSSSYYGILDSNARSMEAWIQTTGNYDPNNGGKQGVIANYGNMSNTNRFTFCVLFNDAIRIEVGGNGLSGTIAINDGDWHHVAVTYDPKDTLDYRLYVDGVLDVAGNLKIATNTISSTPLQLGMRIDNINLFQGSIDEFRLYNYALSQSEIKKNMDREFCDLPKGLVAYYKFNEGKANTFNYSKKTATDYSGNNRNGTLNYFTLSGTASNWVTGAGIKGGPSETRVQKFDCDSVVSPSKKYIWRKDGTYRDTFESIYGCDSIILVTVNIGNDSITIPQFSCGNFTSPKGITVTKDSLITEYYTSISGCDSIVSYQVYILPVYDTLINITACESFQTPLGKIVSKDTLLRDSFNAKNGCDSIISYQIKINKNQYRNDTLVGCDSVVHLGKTYYKSQLTQNAFKTSLGCDSFQTTWIRVNFSQEFPVSISNCDSFVSDAGIVYYKSGIFKEYYTNIRGCDSTRIYQVKIGNSIINTDTLYACNQLWLRDSTYTKSTWVNWKGLTKSQCDSIHNTLVVITTINKLVTVNDSVLFLLENNWDSISWYDCQTSMKVGEDNKPSLLIPYSGNFKARIVKNECSTWTECFKSERTNSVKLSELNAYTIFPNPTTGSIKISGLQLGDLVAIYDLNGKAVSYQQESMLDPTTYIIRYSGLVIVEIHDTKNRKKSQHLLRIY